MIDRGSLHRLLVASALALTVACGEDGTSPQAGGTGATGAGTGAGGNCTGAACGGGGGGTGGGTGGAGSGGIAGDGGAVATGGAGGSSTGGASTGGAGAGGDPSTGGTGGSVDDTRLQIPEGSITLWYDAPAANWNEALPLGNGRLGVMVFGGPANERLGLNESTFWSGGPSRNDNPNALGALANVRQLIFSGQYTEAESVINQNMTATQLHGSMFQPIGNLNLSFPGHDSYTNYYRELDLRRAAFTANYDVGGVTYTREVFVSRPDQ